MSIILKKETHGGQRTGVWEITETEDILRQKVQLGSEEKKLFSGFKSEDRRREWLAVRALLAEMMIGYGSGNVPEIAYSANGKPYLKGNNTALSISHSGPYVAIALHPAGNPGIDIECIHPRLNKIAVRFLHQSEKAFLRQETKLGQLCVIWCCKESLYKVQAGSGIIFSSDIIISPFTFGDSGNITGTTVAEGKRTVYPLFYTRINNHILVYTKG